MRRRRAGPRRGSRPVSRPRAGRGEQGAAGEGDRPRPHGTQRSTLRGGSRGAQNRRSWPRGRGASARGADRQPARPLGGRQRHPHVAPAGAGERLLRREQRELRVVVPAREVGEHHLAARLAEPLLQQAGRVAVRQVPEGPEDPLLERPGIRPVAQHHRVVVGLDQHGVAVAQRLHEAAREVPEVGRVAEAAPGARHDESERAGGVVRHGDRAHAQPAEGTGVAGLDLQQRRQLREVAADRLERAPRPGERHAPLAAEGRRAAGVVAVLVRDEHGVERGRVDAG